MTEQRAAYWTRPEHRKPTPEPCWRLACTNDAATGQDERFRGRYCAGCLELVSADAERMTEELGAMTERVLIYGSRDWADSNAIRDAVHAIPRDAVVIHGGAAGADTLAGRWARANGMKVKVYRADWKTYGKAAGPIRNQQMLDEGKPTRAIGFRSVGVSNGTDDMTRRLVAAGIPHHLVRADAERQMEGLG